MSSIQNTTITDNQPTINMTRDGRRKAFDRTARSCPRAWDKEARQENSERPINHSMSENGFKMERKRMMEC